ncbi:alpha/beta fold hydrolase [Streptomyces clavifer]|uniref:alpha/beta fold hydrolase n=1 Tax=Streptomyces TaxID=1883 RepID=UPI0006F2AD8D|nr:MULTISPECIES: alpha/beta fold hydrolase [unclassified Streptomyces]KQX90791.1 alpha/beta hydrolase [Streptomyces sp. Root1319]KQZ03485.1 alpha/beta hydrolase [Streptomyces sp. Root55]MDX3063118.1 alpha/beta fold hydrolase [Streptomyces sp. ND04-05B]
MTCETEIVDSPVAVPQPPAPDLLAQRPAWTVVESADVPGGRLEHATIEAPLDYARPDGPRITLALSRIRATAPARRRGILLSLNGGPGGDNGTGRGLPARLAAATPLGEVYDLIGFDPRGTGESTRLEGEDSPMTVPFDSRPPDSVFEALAHDMREREQGCLRAGGELRPHVSTRNNARDMDLVRAVLGEERLTFVGWAYGTLLGAVYGTMFGDRLDRSVLDSSVHPDWDWRAQFRSQAEASRENVDAWARWAGERPSAFRLGTGADAVIGSVERAAAALAALPDGIALRTSFDTLVGTLGADRARWDRLGHLVAELTDAAGSGDTAKAGELLSGQSVWRPGRPAGTRREAVLEAVTCETDWPADPEEYHAGMRDFRDRCPYGLGVMRAQPWVGTFRTFTPPEPATRIRHTGYPAGLVVQADGDPLDHHEGGRVMAQRLGHRLIRVTDSGAHEVYALGGNSAVDEHVNRYLLDGTLPADSETLVPGAARPAVPAG